MDEHAEATLPPKSNLPTDSPWWARWIAANAKEAWTWASVRFGAAVAIGAEIYAADPAGVKAAVQNIVPASWWPHIVAAFGLASVLLRVVNLKGNSK